MSAAEMLEGVNGTPERLAGFLKTDAKIAARLKVLFKGKNLSPKVMLELSMASLSSHM